MDNDYAKGFIDGHKLGFIDGVDKGFKIGKGQQAKEVREKMSSWFGEGLNYMKELKKVELQGEKANKVAEKILQDTWIKTIEETLNDKHF